MKIVATIARYLLGLIFLVFGSNLMFHFHAQSADAARTMAAVFGRYGRITLQCAVGFFQAAPAILLLINRYVPLGLTLLGRRS